MCYKELCRIVLGFDDIVHIQPEGKDSIFISRQNNPATITSLAELSMKCKDYSRQYGYVITSNCNMSLINYAHDVNLNKPIKIILYKVHEIDSILEACNWILKELNRI